MIKPRLYTNFCWNLTQSTSTSESRCDESHKKCVEEPTRRGGQVLFFAPIDAAFRQTANKIDVDED